MNITLLIHGVPMGFNTWKSDNSDYLKRFYRELDKNEKMTVEVISTESGPATFYNYLRYNTILDADGRAGSYFGMSLRIDGYECVKIADIFYLMQAVFNNHVIPAVFNVENSTFTYKSEDFTSLDGALSEIENNILRALLSFTNIDRDYAILPKSLPRVMDPCEINPEDLTDKDASLLTKGVRIIVSDDIATRKTKAYEDKIKELNQSLLEARSKADEEQKNYQDKIRELNQSLLLARSKANGGQSETPDNSSDINAALRQEIERLREELRESKSGGFNPPPQDKSGLKKILVLLGLALILVLALVITGKCNSTSDYTENTVPTQPRWDTKWDWGTKRATNRKTERKTNSATEMYQNSDMSTQSIDWNSCRLDVSREENNPLKYKVRIFDRKYNGFFDIQHIPGFIFDSDFGITSEGIIEFKDATDVNFSVWIKNERGDEFLKRSLKKKGWLLYNSKDELIK